ncbi:hypothetical protein AVEN_256591-1 [Araneus ventricosus]|uniref:Uncharacterized protein n=1 Tax=Araneus ventricosus TaxID=182803 RepID=A0A4Y2LIY1_ARAVE|nr:hypothetical protein AVEN_256591-1 [Araneus ventricosus]
MCALPVRSRHAWSHLCQSTFWMRDPIGGRSSIPIRSAGNFTKLFWAQLQMDRVELKFEVADFLPKNALNLPITIDVGIPKCHWKRLSHQKLLDQWEEE